LDLDGTLLNANGEISKQNLEALTEAARCGCTIVLASGRSIRDIRPIARQLPFRTCIVANNGSQTWLDPDTLWSEHRLDSVWVARMRELAERCGVKYWGHGKEGSFYSHPSPSFPKDVHAVHWFQFAVETDDHVKLSIIREEVKKWEHAVEISRARPNQCEINPKGVSKGGGMAELCGHLRIPLDRVVAIGDGMNDLSMLAAAGLGVAMGNAEDELKQGADVVAPSQEEDGVAYVVRRYILE
jgi:hypothetical protein